MCGPQATKVKESEGDTTFKTHYPDKTSSVEVPCICCNEFHRIWKCSLFKSKTISDRRKYAKDQSLCFNCLLVGHHASSCRVKISCRRCHRKHNTLLHYDQESFQDSEDSATNTGNTEKADSVCAAGFRNRVNASGSPIFKVVPVNVWFKDSSKQVSTYAFIDEGSSVNLCSERLVKRLGLLVTATHVELVTSNATSLMDKRVSCIAIQGLGESSAFVVPDAFVVNEVVDVSSSIPTNKMAHAFPHLRCLDFPLLKEKRVDLLLGCDLHQAYLSKDVLVGEPGAPCGIHTGLGWTIYGRDKGDRQLYNETQLMVNFVTTAETNAESCKEIVEVLRKDFEDDGDPSILSLSLEDKYALDILDTTVKKVGNHYSVGLLWKDESAVLPNNRCLAERRLASLKRRFLKDTELFKMYSEKMSEYLEHYAEPVNDEDMPEMRVNYVPHHCITGASKFRVVFDCSARFGGTSLNDQLMHGPDLTNTVVGVLLRFRKSPIALVGDIKGMFSQVLVDENDRDALRFLWFKDGDLQQQPIEYRVRSHVFGANRRHAAPLMRCKGRQVTV